MSSAIGRYGVQTSTRVYIILTSVSYRHSLIASCKCALRPIKR
jgi:hypothetical protein